MFGVLSAIFFGVAFFMYWAGFGGHAPFTIMGMTLLGLFCLAVQVTWGWWPARLRRPPA
jgi:hypothetical protein